MTAMRSNRPLYSVIISSANQLYSGTGRVIFDWIAYAMPHFQFEIVMDSREERSYEVARKFCRENGLPLIALRSASAPGMPDRDLIGLDQYLSRRRPHYIEVHSWANIALNTMVLDLVSSDSFVFFTPHTQPFWTIPDHGRYFSLGRGLERIVSEADLVFGLSSLECEDLARLTCDPERVNLIMNAVQVEQFRPAADRDDKGYVLSISDFRESRKRNDLLLDAFKVAVQQDRSLSLHLAGNNSAKFELDDDLKSHVTRHGYVPEAKLVELYQKASVFVLLSDFEAFGIPIAEALCCGIPVVANATPQIEAIFGGLPGVYLVDNRNDRQVAAAILAACRGRRATDVIAQAAHAAFNFDAVYGKKLRLIRGASKNPKRIANAESNPFRRSDPAAFDAPNCFCERSGLGVENYGV